MTLTRLEELVKNGELHYVQLGGGMGGGSTVSSEVTAWVQRHGTAVDESDYSNGTNSGSSSGSEAGTSAQSGRAAVHRLDPSDVD
ncbi:hypothetical protein ACPXCS_10165 [Streptomyces sp. DT190]|jgi:hypothetical protein|uniref:hypothetical protein n=1 Tax=unclassified Streptomyces TaxID=2593676 RepID=UPI003CEA8A9A